MKYRNFKINYLQLILLINCCVVAKVHAFASNAELNPGETSPEKVEIAIGDSVNISCRMNLHLFRGRNSADLYFIDAHTQQQVPRQDIAIHNESTIVYMLRNAAEQQRSYLCKIGQDAIMDTKVYVGTAPRKVNDFACRSYDFEYMVCNFTQPPNPILTQYNLTFYTHSQDYNYDPLCNYDEKPLVVCNTTLQQKYKNLNFHFALKAINELGTSVQPFDINNWNIMIPARPGNDFRVVDITRDTLQVAWKMPKFDFYKMKGLQWEIMVYPEEINERPLNMSHVPVVRAKNELRLHLNALPYAYSWYNLTLRVRVRSFTHADDTMWSEPFLYRFRTAAARPDRPPQTDVGSFYVDSTETEVRLYWEQLLSNEENGANFSYIISEVKQNGKIIQQQPIKMELNSAVFAWRRNAHYEFAIKSRNNIGESLETSHIEIFPLSLFNSKEHTASSIHNVYHATNRTYTLSWDSPMARENLRDYTVYWCYSKRALQNECKGSLHFKRLNKYTSKFTTEPQSAQQEHTLNLAVSANYFNYNTGMHWTACTVDTDSDLVKMEPEIHATSAYTIHVQWSSESVCPSILIGYNLTYCEVNNSKPTDQPVACIDQPRSIIIDKASKEYMLSELKPFTNYSIELYMYSGKKVGKSSEPKAVRTKEAAPSPPRQLQVSNVTNTSATISWFPPSQHNGNIREYVVILNNEKLYVPANNDSDASTKIVYELSNLTSYTSYMVYVKAQTVDISAPSNNKYFTTLIGYPSMPGSAIPIKDTNNETIIKWSKPTLPAGRVDFYEVAVSVKRNDELLRKRITTVLATTSCALQIPVCIDHEHKTVLEVRAVNAAHRTHEVADFEDSYISAWDADEVYYSEANDDLRCLGGKAQNELIQRYHNSSIFKLYKSPWQHGPTYGCSANRLSKFTTFAVLFVILSLAIMAAVYLARKKYNKMANIDCTLPPGLDSSYPTKTGMDNDIINDRRKEFIFHNEKHHLLAAVSNDSGYLVDGLTLASAGVLLTDGDKISDYLRSNSESSAESLEDKSNSMGSEALENNIDRLNAENVKKIAAKENNASSGDENNELHVLPVDSGCYIKMNWPMPEEVPTTSQCGGGYISVGSIGFMPTASGYVQPHALQKTAMHPTTFLGEARHAAESNNDEYSALNDLSKEPATGIESDPQPAIRDVVSANPLISGYVTQRDLHGITGLLHTGNNLASYNDGYTTLDELGKQAANVAHPQHQQAANGNTVISGYVTQRDLNVFGQQRLA